MQIKKLVAWHIAGWALISCFFIAPIVFVGLSDKILHLMISFACYIGIFYINLFFILPKWIKERKWINLLLYWLILLLSCTSVTILLDHVLHVFERQGHFYLEILNAFLKNCLFVTIFLFVSTAYQSIMDWFRNEKIRHQLENINLVTELAFLKSQINPHFLFNTLNNIYILSYRGNAAMAAEAVLKLSEMMKYILYESGDGKVSVAKEIDYVNQLIDLQQLRMSEPISLNFVISGDLQSTEIAPLLLVPFIENICKHAVLSDKQNPVMLSLAVTDEHLVFNCRNLISFAQKDNVKGIGLPNLKRRLALLYPGKHTLSVLNDDQYYAITLTLQLN